MFKFLKIKSIDHEKAMKALKTAKEARALLNKKIEDLYAQLDGKGDKWFTEHIEEEKKENNNCD